MAKVVDDAVARFNTTKAVSRAASVRKWAFAEKDLSISNGCLTPTMKILRKRVLMQYAGEIDKMYADTEHVEQ